MTDANLKPWKKLSSKVVYKNPWIKIHEDKVIRPNGKPGIYAYLESYPAVFIIALTELNEIYLIKQHRYTIATETIEVPAGSAGLEDFLVAAKRELLEETGLSAKTWEYVGEFYPMVAFASESNQVFIARDLTQTSHHDQAEDGITEHFKVPFSEAMTMIKDGIISGPTITAITKAALHLGMLKFS